MMLAVLTLGLGLLISSVCAADWYTVEWDATQFTAMSGDLVVPKLPQAGGTPYVWPGLQSGNGVLQAVLDGRSGTWWIGDGFYGTPSLPWGNGFNVYPGDTVHFSFTSSGTTWTCTLSSNGKSASTTLNSNFVCITLQHTLTTSQLTNVPFNFGPITYNNVKITATTAASGWCGKTAHLGTYPYTVTSATASGNTCSISKIVQNNA
ncbi:hypothetical protein BDQ12DRAFT_606567 [Crucibulum laeve]|uniref:Concanavalin A-like lectin/glucanase domain-containing protein n=1 Tax=Crucibulum laeve TaxID=68775 RepID=A0A5C3M0C2_9AGAR|nr:hypothetical protein BDQ12DRAFT_606567 [Crucibulum laeve]